MDGHSVRVGSLCWNSYIISSGARSGQIIHHDVRQRDHLVATLSSHSHEVLSFVDCVIGLNERIIDLIIMLRCAV